MREDFMTDNAAVDGLRILATQHSVPEALSRVRSLALERGLTVFAQIDFSGDAQRSGLSLSPTAMIMVGNPAAGTPLIAASPTSAIDLPLKILAWQDAEGLRWLAYNEPDYVKKRHGIAPELVKNIAGIAALAAAAAGSGR
jgi:uncharacterized protein (DUF302 family)